MNPWQQLSAVCRHPELPLSMSTLPTLLLVNTTPVLGTSAMEVPVRIVMTHLTSSLPQALYTVSLTVSGNGGSDTETLIDYIIWFKRTDFCSIQRDTYYQVLHRWTSTSATHPQVTSTPAAWDFGDGGSSSDCNDPSHQFAASGIFTVSLYRLRGWRLRYRDQGRLHHRLRTGNCGFQCYSSFWYCASECRLHELFYR